MRWAGPSLCEAENGGRGLWPSMVGMGAIRDEQRLLYITSPGIFLADGLHGTLIGRDPIRTRYSTLQMQYNAAGSMARKRGEPLAASGVT